MTGSTDRILLSTSCQLSQLLSKLCSNRLSIDPRFAVLQEPTELHPSPLLTKSSQRIHHLTNFSNLVEPLEPTVFVHHRRNKSNGYSLDCPIPHLSEAFDCSFQSHRFEFRRVISNYSSPIFYRSVYILDATDYSHAISSPLS
jgi:hypothetical protein